MSIDKVHVASNGFVEQREDAMTRMFALFTCLSMTGTALTAADVGPNAKDLAAARTKAVNFLKTAQTDDGSWTSKCIKRWNWTDAESSSYFRSK